MRVFETKCDSVKEYIRLLNEHPAYEDFRKMRAAMCKKPKVRFKKLIKTLKAFSTTTDYAERVINMMSKIEKVQSSKE